MRGDDVTIRTVIPGLRVAEPGTSTPPQSIWLCHRLWTRQRREIPAFAGMTDVGDFRFRGNDV